MNGGADGLQRWTQRFTVASAAAFAAFLLATLFGVDPWIAVPIGVFGFVCPMVFGMAYLLVPSYVGQTLVDRRLAGLHFVAAYAGVGLLVWGRVAGDGTVVLLGTLCWTLGVVVFVGALLASVGPALDIDRPLGTLLGGRASGRVPRIAVAAIPIAIGYLLVGTLALLTTAIPLGIGPATLQQVVHYYAVGFGALLVYALGARLLRAFFHVSLPGALVRVVLGAGVLAPAFLGTYLWVDPWFRVGATLASVAMFGYVGLVAVVAGRTDRWRVGLSGIVLGAVAGGTAVAASLPIAFGIGGIERIAVHRTLVLAGFFPLTIVGYAYLFFPIPEGRFVGASARAGQVTIGLLAAGVAIQAVGLFVGNEPFRALGAVLSILGAIGYGYLLGRRFAGG